MDPLMNQKLPRLVGTIFESISLEHKGTNALRGIIEGANDFVAYNGGVTQESTRAMFKGMAMLVREVLDEMETVYKPITDSTNLEAIPPPFALRGSASEGARGKWGRLMKGLRQAGKDRKARTYSERMPNEVLAPGMDAFRESKAPRADPNDNGKGGGKGTRGGKGSGKGAGKGSGTMTTYDKPYDKPATTGKPAMSYAGAAHGFKKSGEIYFIGSTEYDAKKAREVLGKKICLPHFFGFGLKDLENCCPTPGDPRHQQGGEAHTKPADCPKRTEFNLKRGDTNKGKGGGKGGSKGSSKGKSSKGKGKGK